MSPNCVTNALPLQNDASEAIITCETLKDPNPITGHVVDPSGAAKRDGLFYPQYIIP